MSSSELTQWQSIAGSLTLQRFMPDPTHSLRAWDTADELLLSVVLQEDAAATKARWLLLNDEFGALQTAVMLHYRDRPQTRPTLVSVNDSFTGARATVQNLAANGCSDHPEVLPELSATGETFNRVLIKIPKSMALLEDQLFSLRSRLAPSSIVTSAAMDKHLPPTVTALFERVLGETTRSRGVRKARMLTTIPNATHSNTKSPYPRYHSYPQLAAPLAHHAGVFALSRPDQGSMLLADNIPTLDECRTIVDLGCGSGVLGLVAAARNSDAALAFVDESAGAVASAQENWKQMYPDRTASFHHQDCLLPAVQSPVDLILCNPPFHEKFHLSSMTAQRMFEQSRHALRPGGRLLVVGNRHLNWRNSLERLFGRCQQIAQNKKFVLHMAQRR